MRTRALSETHKSINNAKARRRRQPRLASPRAVKMQPRPKLVLDPEKNERKKGG